MLQVLILLVFAAPQQAEGARLGASKVAPPPSGNEVIQVDRRGDGTTTVETPAGPITVITKTAGRPSESEGPAALVKLSLKEVKELLDERKKVKDEWT